MNESVKTTPWWSTLVAAAVASILTFTVVKLLPATGGVTLTAPTMTSSVLTDTLSYIPHILILFGVLADMFTYEGVYSIPSLIAIISIPVNYAFTYFWKGIETIRNVTSLGAETKPAETNPIKGGAADKFIGYTGCEVQGIGFMNSDYAPQTLVVTATIFSYYIFDLLNNRGTTSAIASIVIGLVVFLGQTFAIGVCTPGVSSIFSALRAAAEGMFIGGVSYSVVQTYYPNRLPSAVISSLKSANPNDLSTGADGKLYDSDNRPYVMIDGQAVPDTCNAGSGSSTSSDGTSTGGGGTAAASSSCPS